MGIKHSDDFDPERFFLEAMDAAAAIAQNGLTFGRDKYDLDRYRQLQTLVAELLSHFTSTPMADISERLSQESGYATPKLDVRALVLRGSRVLLVRESIDGLWSLPGGWADINSSARECVEREVLEEAGLIVEAVHLIALHDKQKRDYPPQLPHAYKAFFVCEERGGTLLQETQETSGSRFFDFDDIPTLSEDRITPAQLAHLLSLAEHSRGPCEFD